MCIHSIWYGCTLQSKTSITCGGWWYPFKIRTNNYPSCRVVILGGGSEIPKKNNYPHLLHVIRVVTVRPPPPGLRGLGRAGGIQTPKNFLLHFLLELSHIYPTFFTECNFDVQKSHNSCSKFEITIELNGDNFTNMLISPYSVF